MSKNYGPPPIGDLVLDDAGKFRISWVTFLNGLFGGDPGTSFTPVFTSLTISGTPTITGRYFKLSQSLVYFWVKIVPATNTSSTAGTTYFDFPLDIITDGACHAVTGLLGSAAGMADASTNRIYVPAWTTVTVPLTITGTINAR